MATTEFVILPVTDPDRARRFYARLGWELRPSCGDGGGTVLVRGAEHVMVLSEDRHLYTVGPGAPGTPVDASVVAAIDVGSPVEVDAVVDRAVRAGATEGDAQNYGFLRSRSFRDPDGHLWEVLWVDPGTGARPDGTAAAVSDRAPAVPEPPVRRRPR
ncbi:VOC family protein [Kocuria sabuli]|uniref:VOC family protein n=1 Tax=Kocuria sabuli TaxID=3071448 RepID=UPI0034D5F363